MPVLTIASSKGGPGKTTVAMLLAGSLAGEGLRVVALDADPTQAFARWAGNTYEGTPFESHAEADETRLAHLIDSTVASADVVLVDTAGFGNRAAAVAMTSADVVLVPALSGVAACAEGGSACRRPPFNTGGEQRAHADRGSGEPRLHTSTRARR